jgi:hypothetical protein
MKTTNKLHDNRSPMGENTVERIPKYVRHTPGMTAVL